MTQMSNIKRIHYDRFHPFLREKSKDFNCEAFRSLEIRCFLVDSVAPNISARTERATTANEWAILRVISVQLVVFCICTLQNVASKISQFVASIVVKSDIRCSVENLLINNDFFFVAVKL